MSVLQKANLNYATDFFFFYIKAWIYFPSVNLYNRQIFGHMCLLSVIFNIICVYLLP